MKFSKEWIIMICVVSVASSVIAILIPKSSSQRLFGYLSGAVLIYSFLLPIINSDGNIPDLSSLFTVNSELSSDFNDNSAQSSLSAAQSGYRSVIISELSENDITVDDVEVECTLSDDKITVEKVIIYASLDDNKKETAKEITENLVDKSAEIIFTG